MALFNRADEERIEAAIAAVEQRTAAEIVVVTTHASDSYGAARLAAALLLGLAGALLAHLVWPWLSVTPILAIDAIVVLLVWALSRIPAVLRALVPGELRERSVQRRAALAFLEHQVFRTRDRNGVVILLSELERQVALLGDEGIHARLADAGWSELVRELVRAIHDGRAADGLCDVIRKLGATLALAAPVRADDVNELENRVRESRPPTPTHER